MNVRPIAIHLPQFHPIPENDHHWGKGFTEWTNVTKAQPLFEGHYQPHVPADLGFYDLRVPEARQAQAELAREYGVHGFCYYHYWFTGKKALERPVEDMLQLGKPDFPFMLCWANENWTRKWDGGDKEIIFQQNYSVEDDIAHIQYLIPFFKDPRYIRVNGKVVFCIYRSTLIPNVKETLKIWRDECAKENIELYLCRFETFGDYGIDFIKDGFDAGIEFNPFSAALKEFQKQISDTLSKNLKYRLRHRFNRLLKRDEQNKKNRFQALHRIDYNNFVDFLIDKYKKQDAYTFYPGVTPSWDNSARNAISPFMFLNANPEQFKKWFEFHTRNFVAPSPEENFIFINAWNEWAEGNHLEPDRKWGSQYLQAIKDSLKE
jgi:lipopolysaccharide biosynthesis protein